MPSPSSLDAALKAEVQAFWERASCGEDLYLPGRDREAYRSQAEARYRLEPYIESFAGFRGAAGRKVLEIGVGLGADHQRFAEAGAHAVGLDLTARAVHHTGRRLAAFGLPARLLVGDAEALAFPEASFDIVYSWGVVHHSPDTQAAIHEIWRVLKPGGTARIMVYHRWSMVGLMLWLRYALLAGRPWTGLARIYAQRLESPGTKAYSRADARRLCARFRSCRVETVLTHADLLESGAGQGHAGPALGFARRVWPRWLIRRVLPGAGLFLMISAEK